MSTIKALEELRKCLGDNAVNGYIDMDWDEIHPIIYAIEAEIAERFMELPVDAEGVPVRIGDMMTNGDTAKEVVGIGPDYYVTGKRVGEFRLERHGWDFARDARHSRTVEDVLLGFWNESGKSIEWKELEKRIGEVADEIRGLMADESR